LEPRLRDGEGRLRDLPRPGAKDDPEKSAGALAAWKALKKQVREVLKVQVERLEQALVTARRWTVREFEVLLVRQPLLGLLARGLLWQGFDEEGRALRCFRVAEDGRYVDEQDRPCDLEGAAAVGLAHPLRMSEKERALWGQALADAGVAPPFPQLK